MKPRRRDLILKVINGDARIIPYMYIMDQFVRCDEMLIWLIDNRLTGHNFYEWAKQMFGNFQAEVGRFILTRIAKESEAKKLVLNNSGLIDTLS